MRLPQHQLEAVCYILDSPADLVHALGQDCSPDEAAEIQRLFDLGLPPVTSIAALSVLFGYNPGFIWSLVHRTRRHYRSFRIPKGVGFREINAPHVALKAIQKWLGHHFQTLWHPNENIFGFVPGRSHIGAASKHLGATWVYSVDIENFFPSVSTDRVRDALTKLGYRSEQSLNILSKLCCLGGALAQGAPSSPVLSNIALQAADEQLSAIARRDGVRFTRYADDIVFSGTGELREALLHEIKEVLRSEGWLLANRKEEFSRLPSRLKVHGLLIHGDRVRLTKGYRNRIRAYKHLLATRPAIRDEAIIRGHLNFAAQIEKAAE